MLLGGWISHSITVTSKFFLGFDKGHFQEIPDHGQFRMALDQCDKPAQVLNNLFQIIHDCPRSSMRKLSRTAFNSTIRFEGLYHFDVRQLCASDATTDIEQSLPVFLLVKPRAGPGLLESRRPSKPTPPGGLWLARKMRIIT